MVHPYRPSVVGRAITKCNAWSVELHGEQMHYIARSGGRPFIVELGSVGDVTVARGFLWSTVEIAHPERRIRLRGIPNRRAERLHTAVQNVRADIAHRNGVQTLIADFEDAAARMHIWADALGEAAADQLKQHGWLTREFADYWVTRKAAVGLAALLEKADSEPELRAHIEAHAGSKATIQLWRYDLADFVAQQNDHHMAAQLEANRDFFDSIEKSPLTDEQARAVVCFDNRMLVVASAGSGKTSTMVAKAGYALRRGLVAPDRILMLAFNASAAKELQQRTSERLSSLGRDGDKVVARTFHALGLHIIGQATGRKPNPAPWLESGNDIAQVGRIVEALRATNPVFRTQWDFFRAVLAGDYPDDRAEGENGGASENGSPPQFVTARGETVRSTGEKMIADWLHFNGVEYLYERPYEIDTADADHRQYHPDFYYPQIDSYHEHWALDEHGRPPEEFTGYLEGVIWKKATHKKHGTTLLETSMAELWGGSALGKLAKELTSRGIRLAPDAERILAGQPASENLRLLGTFRTFLTHAKSNRLSDEQLWSRLEAREIGQARYRDTAFMRLFFAIRSEWERQLAADGYVDFEDMLNQSADHLEAGDWQSPFELVMVDEFQDASNARARLVRALVAQPGRHLFAVGDDWQSINRFAGADLSVMTQFEQWFGASETLRLERTFRFPQSIADVSSEFVLKNPEQLAKSVRSSTAEQPPTIDVLSVDKAEAIAPAIRFRLNQLHSQLKSGEVPQPRGRKLSVFVLGRYKHQSSYVIGVGEIADLIDVRFLTVHASKGAEADYIIIPGLVSGKWGFPSTIPNDPVLRLSMPDAETFPRAEERRLFYVALTRARRGVLLVTVERRESHFLMELIADRGLIRRNAIGEPIDSTVCPKCGRAFLVRRSGKRGEFLGCARYPRCKGTV